MKTIGLVDHTQKYKPGGPVLTIMAKALERQARYHYHSVWEKGAHVVVGTDAEQLIHLFDDPESAGYLGWHDVDPEGNPYAHVYAAPSFNHGSNWLNGKYPVSSTISHELLEMLGDPYCVDWAQNGNELWCKEMCDAPEALSYIINVTGGSVPVSDFVTPDFFNPFDLSGRRWDYLHAMTGPFTLLGGGYTIVATISNEGSRDAKVIFGPDVPQWERDLKLQAGSRTSWRRLLTP